MLKMALDQVDYMGKALKLETLNHKIEQYVKLSALVGDEPLPKYSLPLFKELLIRGELPRGKVKDIIGTKDRTASTLIKELIQKDFLESNTPKSPIKLKFNAHFASYLFPELVPQR